MTDKKMELGIDLGDLANLSKPETIALARKILRAAVQATDRRPHVRVVNSGRGSVTISASGRDEQVLAPTEEFAVEPVVLKDVDRADNELRSYLSHGLIIAARYEGSEPTSLTFDVSSIPQNRAGALSFLLERRASGEPPELVGLPRGASFSIDLSPHSELRIVGMGHSLALRTARSDEGAGS